MLAFGVALFMYPIVSNWYGEYTAHTEITSYDQTVQKLGNDALKTLEKKAQEYNKAIAENNSQQVNILDYNHLLAVAESIGYIEIPKIDVYLPIYHGLSDEVLQKGVGHMEGSSLPIGGKGTHCVLAGHTGLPSAKLFTSLDMLKSGDYFYIHVLDKVLAYKIDQIKIVLPWETEDTQIVQGEDYITLVTCTPYGINDHRLLVRGSRVPYETKTMEENKDKWPIVHKEEEVRIPARTILWYGGLAVVSGVFLVVLMILFMPVFKHKKKNKNNSS